MTLNLPAPGNWCGEMTLQTRPSPANWSQVRMSNSKAQSLQELAEKVESRRRRTSFWYRSIEDQRVDLGTIYADNDESRHSSWTKLRWKFGRFQEHKLQGTSDFFDTTQKLMLNHQSEILNVTTIEWTSLSWTRSTLSHDQLIMWTKAKVRVNSHSVLCLGKMPVHSEANGRWENQVKYFSTVQFLQGIAGSRWRTD